MEGTVAVLTQSCPTGSSPSGSGYSRCEAAPASVPAAPMDLTGQHGHNPDIVMGQATPCDPGHCSDGEGVVKVAVSGTPIVPSLGRRMHGPLSPLL